MTWTPKTNTDTNWQTPSANSTSWSAGSSDNNSWTGRDELVYLLTEDDEKLVQEDDTGFILLEEAFWDLWQEATEAQTTWSELI